jgi:hypothetical protein
MALFSECIQKCARKLLDSADIVRDGDLDEAAGAADAIACSGGGSLCGMRQALDYR